MLAEGPKQDWAQSWHHRKGGTRVKSVKVSSRVNRPRSNSNFAIGWVIPGLSFFICNMEMMLTPPVRAARCGFHEGTMHSAQNGGRGSGLPPYGKESFTYGTCYLFCCCIRLFRIYHGPTFTIYLCAYLLSSVHL